MLYRLHADHEAEHRHEDLERSMLERAVEEETQRERERLDAAQVQLARTQAEQANLHTLQEAGARRVLLDGHREAGMEEVTLAACWSMLLLCLWQQHLGTHLQCSLVPRLSFSEGRAWERGYLQWTDTVKSEMYMLGVYPLFIC